MTERETLFPALTRNMERVLHVLNVYGEVGEMTLWLEGLNTPRNTCRALERRGLIVRGEWLNENDGYLWRLAS